LKDPDLKDWLQQDSASVDFTSVTSSLEMQASPCYCDVKIQTQK